MAATRLAWRSRATGKAIALLKVAFSAIIKESVKYSPKSVQVDKVHDGL